ncbi:MAG TPA: RuBisCO large subunit C-terminal-like domain-containing protein [Nitrococcus sp.]|nr:RuBisCO large subunit C-terminal-like domain-containing protein [Nitrococcus sp.]
MTKRFEVIYCLTLASGESAQSKVRDISLEQTAELPQALVSDDVLQRMVGCVESIAAVGRRQYLARISYPVECIGADLTQCLNVLFGNISLKRGIRIVDIRWPDELLRIFGGPGYGIAGVRRLTGIEHRPLLATALKPMGLQPAQLARLCRDFALGGLDIVKDDHGLADQTSAPFRERVEHCQAAITAGNRETAGHTLYFPNVTAAPWELAERARYAKQAGCLGVLINPWLTGLDAMRWIRDHCGLMIMAHPALTGAYLHPNHGIAAELLLGDLFRIAGADTVIYPNAGGRFGFSRALCEKINQRLRQPLGDLAASFPTPGGGISTERAAEWAKRYGPDTIFLIGGSLYEQGDLVAASRKLKQAIGG